MLTFLLFYICFQAFKENIFNILITNKYNPALEPFFNAAASQFILGQQVPFTLWLSLAPVVIGNFWLLHFLLVMLSVYNLGLFLHNIFIITVIMV